MDTFWLVLRVVVSLAIVIGLIWALARVRKRVSPKGASALQILSKVPVSKRGSILLVEIGGKTLLIGSTDSAISLLSEVDLSKDEEGVPQKRTPIDFSALLDEWRTEGTDDVLLVEATPEELAAAIPVPRQGPLAGSVLSPQTWRQLGQVLRERTVRS
jgi:flagellar protein FliO/FliZ